jgi:transposase
MNIHKNARLTQQGRHLLVRRIEEFGWRMAEAAKAAGISQRQGYRWLARYRSGGEAELGDRSSAPRCCKHRVTAERISEITGLREQRMSGPVIARQLGMPVSTVGAILRRLGIGKPAALEPKPAVVRYQRQRPGELIHLDSKKLGRIAGIGHRITGRSAQPERPHEPQHLGVWGNGSSHGARNYGRVAHNSGYQWCQFYSWDCSIAPATSHS